MNQIISAMKQFNEAKTILTNSTVLNMGWKDNIDIEKLTLTEQKEIISFLLENGEFRYTYGKAEKLTERGYIYIKLFYGNFVLSVGTLYIPPAKNKRMNGTEYLVNNFVSKVFADFEEKQFENLRKQNHTLLAYIMTQAKQMGKIPEKAMNDKAFPPEKFDTWEKVEAELKPEFEKHLSKIIEPLTN